MTPLSLLLLALVVLGAALRPCSAQPCSSTSNSAQLTLQSQTGLFEDVGPMNPQAYQGNEFWADDWLYEGLVRYGAGGAILPSLATSWSVGAPDPTTGQVQLSFTLRQGVQFSDGQPWNATVAVMNLDHILAYPLVDPANGIHSWYDLPGLIHSWSAVSTYQLLITLSEYYYPALQELSCIRPIRFLSPAAFPSTGNFCPPQWGNVSSTLSNGSTLTVHCNGIRAPIGTGQWLFVNRSYSSSGVVSSVLFANNPTHWGGSANLSSLEVVAYYNASQITADLLSGSLQLAYNVVLDADFRAVFSHASTASNFTAQLGSLFQTRTVQFNSQVPGLSDPRVRWALIHLIDKSQLIQQVLFGMETDADTLFAPGTPYTNGVELYPVPQLDLQAAALLLSAAGYVQSNSSGMWMTASSPSAGQQPLSFVLTYTNTDPVQTALATALSAQWQSRGLNVSLLGLSAADWETSARLGTYQMFFTETWGAPYDPQSSVEAFLTNDNGGVYALANISDGIGGFQTFSSQVSAVIAEANATARQADWTVILQTLHSNGVFFPISYTTNQAVWNQDIAGVQFGVSQYDLPMSTVQCVPYQMAHSASSSIPASSASSSASPLTLWTAVALVIGLSTAAM